MSLSLLKQRGGVLKVQGCHCHSWHKEGVNFFDFFLRITCTLKGVTIKKNDFNKKAFQDMLSIFYILAISGEGS